MAATYTYTDEYGNALFCSERRVPKAFRQYRVVDGRRVWNLRGVRLVLYRLPAVIEAAERRDRLRRRGQEGRARDRGRGAVATATQWRGQMAAGSPPSLAGAKVIIVADADEPGRKHAADVAASLAGKAAAVAVVEAAEGKDAADHLAAGRTLAEFVPTRASRPASTSSAPRCSTAPPSRSCPPRTTDRRQAVPGLPGVAARQARERQKPGRARLGVLIDAGLPWLGQPVRQGPVLYVSPKARPACTRESAPGKTAPR